MRNRSVLLLAVLAAVGCSTLNTSSVGTDLSDHPQVDCSPDLEGRFVAGSSGALVNVPLRGSIHLRFSDGKAAPATVASIQLADQPCPHRDRQALTLSSKGRFEARFALPTDTHWCCKHGQLVRSETVAALDLRLLVPGCDEVSFTFAGESQEKTFQVTCPGPAAAYTPRSPQSIDKVTPGARVAIRGSILLIQGAEVSVPPTVRDLEHLLGPASAFVPARGDAYSNDAYEWEASGVYGFARPGNSQLHALAFVLDPSLNDRHWCDAGTVILTVNGVPIFPHTGAGRLRRAGFKHSDESWERRTKSFDMLLSDYVPGTFKELWLSVPRDGA
jgi:hypothetical protein